MQYLSKNPNGQYYLRLRVPAPLVKHLDKQEILFSLRTECHNKAKQRCHILIAKVFYLFEKSERERMTWQNFKSKLTHTFNQMLVEEAELINLHGPKSQRRLNYLSELQSDYVEMSEIAREKNTSIKDFMDYMRTSPNQKYLIERLMKEINRHEIADTDPNLYAEIMNMLSQFYRQAINLHNDAKKYNLYEIPMAHGHEHPSKVNHKVNEGECIKATFQKYVEERDNAGNWSEKTRKETISTLKDFTEIFGNAGCAELDRTNARSFKDILLKLPANLSTIREKNFSGKSMKEISDLNHLRPLSPVTVNKKLAFIRSYYQWCKDNSYCEDNIFTDIRAITPRQSAQDDRDHFEPDQMSLIINTVLKDKRDWGKWVVLIAAYSGLRINEICQLYKDDIVNADDILCFRISTEHSDQKLKNINSKRLVPIHDHLLKLGFNEYVNQIDSKRLFPKFKRTINGYGDKVGKWFNRTFLNSLGLKTPKKTFHSLRHTFITNLKQLETDESIVKAIVGHSQQSITYGRYGGNYHLSTLRNTINTIEYNLPEINI